MTRQELKERIQNLMNMDLEEFKTLKEVRSYIDEVDGKLVCVYEEKDIIIDYKDYGLFDPMEELKQTVIFVLDEKQDNLEKLTSKMYKELDEEDRELLGDMISEFDATTITERPTKTDISFSSGLSVSGTIRMDHENILVQPDPNAFIFDPEEKNLFRLEKTYDIEESSMEEMILNKLEFVQKALQQIKDDTKFIIDFMERYGIEYEPEPSQEIELEEKKEKEESIFVDGNTKKSPEKEKELTLAK